MLYSLGELFGKGYATSPALLRYDVIVRVVLQTIFQGQTNTGGDNDNVAVSTSKR